MQDKPEKDILVQSIDVLIPKTLDDVMRKNRELVELCLSTAEEIRALDGEIRHGLPVKGIIRRLALHHQLAGKAVRQGPSSHARAQPNGKRALDYLRNCKDRFASKLCSDEKRITL